MNNKILILSISLFFLNTNVSANELQTTSWNFPTPDKIQVSQNRVLLFCDANPSKCPVGLNKGRGGAGAGKGSSLVDPKTSSSANNISVVLAGDNSSVTLTTSQDAKDNTMNSSSEIDATIDHDEVLNYTNN
ncbi:MAG: hypothetical protein KAH22_09805 [Thiotrichaceae bacterium]|nr:hypothetical protein [Thiotrichaceae bacterium]